MLIAKWTDFAKAAVVLPDDGEEGRVKRCVPAIIGVQALTCAAREANSLAPAERRAGLDMARVQLRQFAATIHEAWKGEALHPGVQELLDDCRAAIDDAARAGRAWFVTAPRLVVDHPAELLAGLIEGGFAGDLFLPAPGVPLFPTCPSAFMRGAGGGEPDAASARAVEEYLAAGVESDSKGGKGTRGGGQGGGQGGGGRGVVSRACAHMLMAYRQFDFAKGGPVQDLVVVHDRAVPAGQPLLVPAILAGEAQAVPLPIPAARGQEELPVEFEEDA
jgi:hypothetical protein